LLHPPKYRLPTKSASDALRFFAIDSRRLHAGQLSFGRRASTVCASTVHSSSSFRSHYWILSSATGCACAARRAESSLLQFGMQRKRERDSMRSNLWMRS